ncbi:multicopper oxidase domain-containing protein, partial [Enterococcus hirae]|uniref:multicopper oxidase domain-containing protein n=1 Tax=Enterococcus hirae TaxID=1354 RepID=UPI00136921B1
LVMASDLRASSNTRLVDQKPDRSHDIALGSDMGSYTWTLNGRSYGNHIPLPVGRGERVELAFRNTTMMFHPMHLHGHTFQLRTSSGLDGPRKDTVIVPPMETVTVAFDADNPGDWATHCHNAYHQDAGMMTVIEYQK